MARHARIKSTTGIYHVMLRGNEGKAVFKDEEDKNKFVEIMLKKREAADSRLYAYCVMDTHIHMVVHEVANGQTLDALMKRIGVSYAIYFNKKYKRVGHVFQDRFKSEAIENDLYLLSVIRYVHQNPVKAGITAVSQYYWSSYSGYIGRSDMNVPLLPEMESILAMFSSGRAAAIREFSKFHDAEEEQRFIDVEAISNTEGDAAIVMANFLAKHGLTTEALKQMGNREMAVALVEELIQRTPLSGRQVAELTGLNREMVRKILLSKEPSP